MITVPEEKFNFIPYILKEIFSRENLTTEAKVPTIFRLS